MDDPAIKWILIMINGAFGEGFPMLERKKKKKSLYGNVFCYVAIAA